MRMNKSISIKPYIPNRLNRIAQGKKKIASISNRTNKTADSFFSAAPEELKQIVDSSKIVYQAIGEVNPL